MRKKIHVHVADDHKILIEGIIAVLNTDADIKIRDYSLTGQEVVDWFSIRKNTADVLILDLTMPILDGFEVLKHFYTKGSKQKVIVLSSYDDIKIVQEVINLGAKGYISKGNAGEHIVKAIKAVANGENYYSDDIQSILVQSIATKKELETAAAETALFESLTGKELQVLRLIAKEYSTSKIAADLEISSHTVETHRKKLLIKLDVKSSVGLAMYAVKYKIV